MAGGLVGVFEGLCVCVSSLHLRACLTHNCHIGLSYVGNGTWSW